MGSLGKEQLHVFFFPFMAHGHTIPALDLAKLFVSRGVKASIVTTPLNVPYISKAIANTDIGIRTIRFPSVEAGLPEGCENADGITTQGAEGRGLVEKFLKATTMLQEPLEQLLEEARPDCIVADMFFPWSTDAAAKFGIPRLVFHGIGVLALCAAECVRRYEPYKNVLSDSEQFVLPGLPGGFKLIRNQVPDHVKNDVENVFTRMMKLVLESETKSFGVVINSFYELESAYADYYRNELGRNAWQVGPVLLCNQNSEDKQQRGKETAIEEHECLKWLDSKKPNSVIYICFGSMANFRASQLKEIAIGLEASGQQFIWVVRKGIDQEEETEEWLPEGFEKRIEGKGLIIRGWAPQVLILNHEAVGGFVTHCGWNSTLESISAGVPMVTWPVAAEQFYNEKLVTEVLNIGVAVGAKKWVRMYGDFVKNEAVEKAVSRLMVGEDAEEMRSRAKVLGKMAQKAVQEGGSSYNDLNALIDELRLRRH
ncbi:scopoletin glucosyltransferase-like [Tripterygium wilfordii]|uniref:scopoletin glucosyltransferase-like n=1 Tax=Tripterygium wilfordii TaxID=458696 RepID=UPI0018F84AD2|nr:scopoletin glucosyltransferase-like [Tripterygium wilfordii]